MVTESATPSSPSWVLGGVLFAHQVRRLAASPEVPQLFARLVRGAPEVTMPESPAALERLRRDADHWAFCADTWITGSDGVRRSALLVEVCVDGVVERLAFPYAGRPPQFVPVETTPDVQRLAKGLLRSSVRPELRDAALAVLTPRVRTHAWRIPGARRPTAEALRAALGPVEIGEDAEGLSLLVPGRSTRGVELFFEGGVGSVEVRTGASADDLQLGVRVAAHLAEEARSAVSTDQGAETPASFVAQRDGAWAAAEEGASLDALRAEVERAEVGLFVGGRSVLLGASVRAALAAAPAPRAELLERLRALAWPPSAQVRVPPTFRVGPRRVQTWDGARTLLDRRVEATDLADRDSGTSRLVDTGALLAALGPSTAWDDATVVTPALEGDAWRALRASLPELPPVDARPVGEGPSSAILTAAHLAVVGAGVLVARADGDFDGDEKRALLRVLLARGARGGLLAPLLERGPAPLVMAMVTAAQAPDLPALLRHVFAKAEAELPADQRPAWRDEVRAVARTVAEASGPRRWVLFGSRTSAAEDAALRALDELLAEPH